MKKLALLLTASLAFVAPVFGADADLEARIAALEERVAALEAQIGGGTVAETEQTVSEGELTAEGNGFTLTFTGCETTKDYEGMDCVLLYFDFTNISGDTRSAVEAFNVKIFQHGIEQQGYPMLNDDPQELTSRGADIKPGAETIKVAWLEPITDMSEIDVEVIPMPNSNNEPLEFTVSLE